MTIQRISLAALVVLTAIAVTGCSLLEKDPEYREISATDGLYHFQMPFEWQALVDSQAIAVYAADELPAADEAANTLSIIALSSANATDAPVPDELVRITNNRSVQRSWTDTVIGEPVESAVGSRPAYYVEVAANDSSGNPFEGRFYLVRTSAREVLIVAVAPKDLYADYVDDLEGLVERWYWHQPETQEIELDADVPKETTGTVE